jgi:beta-hydroxylase
VTVRSDASRRAFFDPADFQRLDSIRDAYPVIREEGLEALNLLAHRDFVYGNQFSGEGRGFSGKWARFYLHFCGMNIGVNRRLCPQTSAITERLPGLVTAGFYLLGPSSHVEPHTGICDNIKRSHLGLVCPPDCALRIGDDVRSWREGELLIFDDTIEHEAWNRSGAMRIVLHLDFFDPLDQDPDTCERTLRWLREFNVHSNQENQLWLAAAETSMDDDLAAIVAVTVAQAESTPAGVRQMAAIRSLVRTCGLFLT